MSKVIYPGTFDPITLGHMDVLKRIAKIFDCIILGVAADSRKNTLFSVEERVAMARNEMQEQGLKNVEVQSFNGLLVDFARRVDSKIIVRGLRAVSDFEYEFQMSYINNKLTSDIETMFIPATANGHFISSSFVKEIARLDGKLEGLASSYVIEKLKEKNA